MRFLELDARTLVADGPVQANDVAAAAALGVTMIVNNRPDGEEPGQPAGAAIAAAAQAAGLSYAHLPISAGFPGAAIDALSEVLGKSEGRVLLFCRSGTRSTHLWALARARAGAEADPLIRRAAAAGYDIRPLLPWLKAPGA